MPFDTSDSPADVTSRASTNPALSAADLVMFGRLGIGPELLAEARVRRVTDAQAREDYGIIAEATADMSGVVFPYFSPTTGRRTTARVRRDHPEAAEGKVQRKYMIPFGDPRHLFFPPGAAAKLLQPDLPVVLVEAEKSALALTAWAQRTGMPHIALAMGGCFGWLGKHIRKEIAPDGERVDVAGPLPDLAYCNGRKIYLMLDANAATNSQVQQARMRLADELLKPARECEVLICELPQVDGVNGPDDYIGARGDAAMTEVFAVARPTQPARKVVSMPSPSTRLVKAQLPYGEAQRLTDDLLARLQVWIKRYVVVTNQQALIMAVWVLHTYVMDAAEYTPYLHITGPEKSVGKSLLLDVLAVVTCNPITASGTTPAALVRAVDKYAPTLLLDEMDATSNSNKEMAEALRGILNAGFRRGARFLKCDGKSNELRSFNVFCPKCLAGIGELPSTVASRSIAIEMRRKLRSEVVERYRGREVAQLAVPLRAELESWGGGVIEQLRGIEPAQIDALPDRTNDVAEPLLAIAQFAGGDWLDRVKAALLSVYSSAAAEDASMGVRLLTDIRDIFEARREAQIPSQDLAAALCGVEGRPWAEWSRERGFSANNLARQLSKYRIFPLNIRLGSSVFKGYRRGDFSDAWERYCPRAG